MYVDRGAKVETVQVIIFNKEENIFRFPDSFKKNDIKVLNSKSINSLKYLNLKSLKKNIFQILGFKRF